MLKRKAILQRAIRAERVEQAGFNILTYTTRHCPIVIPASPKRSFVTGGGPKRLRVLLEGEALLNDASSFTLFEIFLTLVEQLNSGEYHAQTGGQVLWEIVKSALKLAGGRLFGFIGRHCALCLVYVRINVSSFQSVKTFWTTSSIGNLKMSRLTARSKSSVHDDCLHDHFGPDIISTAAQVALALVWPLGLPVNTSCAS